MTSTIKVVWTDPDGVDREHELQIVDFSLDDES